MILESVHLKKLQRRLVWFIIALVVMSQLSITMILPSLPKMIYYFHTTASTLQLAITLYLLGYGLSQFVYGPLSDIFGRRKIILVGVSIFSIASIFCAIGYSTTFFLIARFFQGVGIGCGDTMGRAILKDKFNDRQFIKAACNIGLAATVTPLIAPIFGGYIDTYLGWQMIFILTLIYAVSILTLCYYYLPETKPDTTHACYKITSIIKNYLSILAHRQFITFFIPGVIWFVGESIYSMMSPFILQVRLHMTPITFGWINLVPACGLLTGTLSANILAHYVNYKNMVFAGMILLVTATSCMLLAVTLHHVTIWTIVIPMMVFMAGVGIIYPNTNLGALSPFTANAGTAGALQGGMQMLLAGSTGILIGANGSTSEVSLAVVLTLLTVAGLAIFTQLNKSPSLQTSQTPF